MKPKNTNDSWFSDFSLPFIIAGPCSAESENQMLQTAQRIKESSVDIPVFRAGIWKPRTRPNGFEGVGEIGLKWLKRVKEEFGFLTATEVANPYHIQATIREEVDILWIGARTTVNPFLIQEIAENLKDTEKMIWIKNPVNPDLALWIGAVQRFLGQGIEKIGVIHRGFSTYQKTKYRNNPHWQIALDFKNEFPDIPMLIDPSHICGNRVDLAHTTQEALNLGYQGAIIETHCSPDEAWSDAQQQITPEDLAKWIKTLELRDKKTPTQLKDIEIYRTFISEIDYKIIELLKERMDFVEKIGHLKNENNLEIFQPKRWQKITEYTENKAKETGLCPEFIQNLFKLIHQEAISLQNNLKNP